MPRPQASYQPNEEENDSHSGHYLPQKLNKHKSQTNFKNKTTLKTTHKTRVEDDKKIKKMVSHPQIPKNYPRARTGDEKKMTKAVRKAIAIGKREGMKDKENRSNLTRVTSNGHLDKKKRELGHYIVEGRGQGRKDESKKRKLATLTEKNSEKLKRLLKWKQANMVKQKRQI